MSSGFVVDEADFVDDDALLMLDLNNIGPGPSDASLTSARFDGSQPVAARPAAAPEPRPSPPPLSPPLSACRIGMYRSRKKQFGASNAAPRRRPLAPHPANIEFTPSSSSSKPIFNGINKRKPQPLQRASQQSDSQAAFSAAGAGGVRRGAGTDRKKQMRVDRIFRAAPRAEMTQEELSRRVAEFNASRGADAVPLDPIAARTFFYPKSKDKELRTYQQQFARACMSRNTLVCLPTGLGKTFIAAVVMLNFFRWYPTGRIVFIAPTKPLVNQQIKACHAVMGIDQRHMRALVGTISRPRRKRIWNDPQVRVLFCTPQTLISDINCRAVPTSSIVLLIADEAHHATGNHAYVTAVKELSIATRHFRVVGLSATPGKNIETVNRVVRNLRIAHLRIMDDEDPDVRRYVHGKDVDSILCPDSPDIAQMDAGLTSIVRSIHGRLVRARADVYRPPESMPFYTVQQAFASFRRQPPDVDRRTHNRLCKDFVVVMQLLQARKRLRTYGVRSAHDYLTEKILNPKNYQMREVRTYPEFVRLMARADEYLARGEPDPKQEVLKRVMAKHFNRAKARANPLRTGAASSSSSTPTPTQPAATKAIVFTEFRDSVDRLVAVLRSLHPLVRPTAFIGQSAQRSGAGSGPAGARTKGLTQKQQAAVLERFHRGDVNTLVATSIAEEGLDIGEVDLIVAYNVSTSSVRTLQRMGRTGRKRAGRCVTLLTASDKKKYDASIKEASKSLKRLKRWVDQDHINLAERLSPRMLPSGVTPRLTHVKPSDGPTFVTASQQRRNKRSERKQRARGGGTVFLLPAQTAWLQAEWTLTRAEKDALRPMSLGRFMHRQGVLGPTCAVNHSDTTSILVKVAALAQDGVSCTPPASPASLSQSRVPRRKRRKRRRAVALAAHPSPPRPQSRDSAFESPCGDIGAENEMVSSPVSDSDDAMSVHDWFDDEALMAIPQSPPKIEQAHVDVADGSGPQRPDPPPAFQYESDEKSNVKAQEKPNQEKPNPEKTNQEKCSVSEKKEQGNTGDGGVSVGEFASRKPRTASNSSEGSRIADIIRAERAREIQVAAVKRHTNPIKKPIISKTTRKTAKRKQKSRSLRTGKREAMVGPPAGGNNRVNNAITKYFIAQPGARADDAAAKPQRAAAPHFHINQVMSASLEDPSLNPKNLICAGLDVDDPWDTARAIRVYMAGMRKRAPKPVMRAAENGSPPKQQRTTIASLALESQSGGMTAPTASRAATSSAAAVASGIDLSRFATAATAPGPEGEEQRMWACSACTFINQGAAHPVCVMCGTRSAGGPGGAASMRESPATVRISGRTSQSEEPTPESARMPARRRRRRCAVVVESPTEPSSHAQSQQSPASELSARTARRVSFGPVTELGETAGCAGGGEAPHSTLTSPPPPLQRPQGTKRNRKRRLVSKAAAAAAAASAAPTSPAMKPPAHKSRRKRLKPAAKRIASDRRARRAFVDEMAECDDGGAGSSEEDGQDTDLSGFIDDRTQFTQSQSQRSVDDGDPGDSCKSPPDMQAVYHRSLLSPSQGGFAGASRFAQNRGTTAALEAAMAAVSRMERETALGQRAEEIIPVESPESRRSRNPRGTPSAASSSPSPRRLFRRPHHRTPVTTLRLKSPTATQASFCQGKVRKSHSSAVDESDGDDNSQWALDQSNLIHDIPNGVEAALLNAPSAQDTKLITANVPAFDEEDDEDEDDEFPLPNFTLKPVGSAMSTKSDQQAVVRGGGGGGSALSDDSEDDIILPNFKLASSTRALSPKGMLPAAASAAPARPTQKRLGKSEKSLQSPHTAASASSETPPSSSASSSLPTARRGTGFFAPRARDHVRLLPTGTRPIIIVDARESNAPGVSQELRRKYKVSPVVASLRGSVGYVLGPGVAALRFSKSELSKRVRKGEPPRWRQRVAAARRDYDMVYLVVQDDHARGESYLAKYGEPQAYLRSVASLAVTRGVSVLYAEGPQDAARALYDVAVAQQSGLEAPIVVPERAERSAALQVLLSAPGVGYIFALSLLVEFDFRLLEVVNAPPDRLVQRMRRWRVSPERARALALYFRRQFDPNMVIKHVL